MAKFNLCDDMLKIEILSHTCMTTLAVVRCTCKDLDKLTYEPYFLDMYKKRNDMVSGFLMQKCNTSYEFVHAFSPSRGSKSIDLHFLPYNARILASSDHGIVAFESPHPIMYVLILYHVCKPATQHVVAIPNPKTRYVPTNVAIVIMHSKSFHYKIIRLSHSPVVISGGGVYSLIRCEVFDSRSWAWKMLAPVMLPFCVFPTIDQPLTLSGSVYMLLCTKYILTFDAYSEKWRILPHAVIPTDYRYFQLIKHDQNIGLACMSYDGRCEVWIRGSNGLWANIYILDEQPSNYLTNLKFDDPYSSVMIYSNVLLFHKGNNIDNVATTDHKLFVYKSDFEPANLTIRLE